MANKKRNGDTSGAPSASGASAGMQSGTDVRTGVSSAESPDALTEDQLAERIAIISGRTTADRRR